MKRAAAVLGIALLAGCAPRPSAPVDVTRDLVRERFETRQAQRVAQAAGFEAQLLVWTRIRDEKYPGVEARVLLASPERARVRVASAFGTAADLVLHGDSALAWIPSRRTVVQVDAAGESLGVRDPARWLVSALTATWNPPAAAWASAERRDSLVYVTWTEDGWVRELDLGSSGLPRAARVHSEAGTPLEIRYLGWVGAAGVSWPARGTVASGDGRWSATWRLERHRAIGPPDPARFRLAPPANARRVTLTELRAAFTETFEESE